MLKRDKTYEELSLGRQQKLSLFFVLILFLLFHPLTPSWALLEANLVH